MVSVGKYILPNLRGINIFYFISHVAISQKTCVNGYYCDEKCDLFPSGYAITKHSSKVATFL